MNKKYIPFKTSSPIYKPEDIIKVLDMSVNDSMLISTRKRLIPHNKRSPIYTHIMYPVRLILRQAHL